MSYNLRKRVPNLWANVWEYLKHILEVILHSFLLSGLLLLNFLVLTAVLVIVEFHTNIQLASVPIQRPNGLYAILFIMIIPVGLAIAVEREGWFKQILERLSRFTWKYVSIHDTDNLFKPEIEEYKDKKRIYVDYSTQALPAISLGLCTPLVLGYTYTEPINFSSVSVLYIAFGVFIGSFRTVFNRQVIRNSQEAKFDQEISEVVAKQFEATLLLTGAVAQILGVYNVRIAELGPLLATLALSILFVGPAFFIYFRYSPEYSAEEKMD